MEIEHLKTELPKDFSFLKKWLDRSDIEAARREMKKDNGFLISKRQVYNIIKGKQTNIRFLKILARKANENFKVISEAEKLRVN